MFLGYPTSVDLLNAYFPYSGLVVLHILACLSCGRYSTLTRDLFDKPCKLVVYVDSAGCNSCRLQLPEWKALLEEMEPTMKLISTANRP